MIEKTHKIHHCKKLKYQLLPGWSTLVSDDFDDLESGFCQEGCDVVWRFSWRNVRNVKVLVRDYDAL